MTRNDRKARNSNPGAGGLAESLRSALAQRVVVADGAMGTMLQASSATLSDFDGHEGCNEILNITRPDIVRSVHDGYLEAGVDCITTNTFGANLGNLGEYGLQDRIGELSEAGARIARATPRACCAAGWTRSSSRPARTCCRPRRPSSA
jgi:5-methyltetrahydrofolate--homocysteine methyltransferase